MKSFIPFVSLLAMIALLAYGVAHETQRVTTLIQTNEKCDVQADNLLKANKEWMAMAREVLDLNHADVNKVMAPHFDKVQSILRGPQ